jgi:hypothetical protein
MVPPGWSIRELLFLGVPVGSLLEVDGALNACLYGRELR